MKNHLRRILLVLMAAFSLVLLSACSQEASEDETVDAAVEAQLDQQADAVLQQIMSFDDEQLDSLIEEYNLDQEAVLAAGLNSWKSAKEDLGAYISTDSMETERTDDKGYRTTLHLKFEDRDCEFTLGLNRKMTEITEITFTPDYTLGEMIEEAAGNLVVGMGTVFVVLTIIMCVISLFKFIPQDIGQKKPKAAMEAGASQAKSGAAQSAEAGAGTSAGAAAAEYAASGAALAAAGASQTSDEELQAVIAAAVAAYESENNGPQGAPLANGLVVRSIKRVSGGRKR